MPATASCNLFANICYTDLLLSSIPMSESAASIGSVFSVSLMVGMTLISSGFSFDVSACICASSFAPF
jgi:hypothetical protein